MASENAGIQGYVSTRKTKKGPMPYKPAKSRKEDKGKYTSTMGAKPKNNKRVSSVDKKVKRIARKMIPTKGNTNPGMATFNYNGGNSSAGYSGAII